MMGDMADMQIEDGMMPWDGIGPDPEEHELIELRAENEQIQKDAKEMVDAILDGRCFSTCYHGSRGRDVDCRENDPEREFDWCYFCTLREYAEQWLEKYEKEGE